MRASSSGASRWGRPRDIAIAQTPNSVAVRVTPSITGLNGIAMKNALIITSSARVSRARSKSPGVHELPIAPQQRDLRVGHPAQQQPDPQDPALGEEQDEVVVERQRLAVPQALGDGLRS